MTFANRAQRLSGTMKPEVPIEVHPGSAVYVYSKDEVKLIRQDWLNAYAKGGELVVPKHFLWEIFSGQRFPCISGDAALKQYKLQVSTKFIILSDDGTVALSTDTRPEWCSLRDYFVFPPNLAWTMAFTHEDGWIGPLFARHAEYVALNRLNEQKFREIDVARSKGWLGSND